MSHVARKRFGQHFLTDRMTIDAIIDAIESEMRSLACGKEVGAIISAKAKERIEGYITRAAERGATVRLDGRNQPGPGHYVAPTLIDGISREDECANDEIFGPVLSILRVKTLDEAIAIENARLHRETDQRLAKKVEDLKILQGISVSIAATLNPLTGNDTSPLGILFNQAFIVFFFINGR